MGIIEKVRKDLLHVYGSDPLYLAFLTAKTPEEQNRAKDTLVSIRGMFAYKSLCKFFREKIEIYKLEEKKP